MQTGTFNGNESGWEFERRFGQDEELDGLRQRFQAAFRLRVRTEKGVTVGE